MADLSSIFSGLPTRDANAPSLEDQWSAVLKRPDFQAGLLGFGIELMKPKWMGGAAALPDALAAGARGFAGVQEAEEIQAQADEQNERSSREAAANRQNRLETAKIGADSRAEVQGLRNAALLERETVRRSLVNPTKTPEEQKAWDSVYKAALNDILGPDDPVARQQMAQERADNMLIARRARFGTGPNTNAVPGQIPSQNSPNGGGLVSPPGGGQTPKNTSTNTQNKLSAAEAISKLKAAGRWPLPAASMEWLKNQVRDPENLSSKILPPGPSTMEGF